MKIDRLVIRIEPQEFGYPRHDPDWLTIDVTVETDRPISVNDNFTRGGAATFRQVVRQNEFKSRFKLLMENATYQIEKLITENTHTEVQDEQQHK
jgi:hypothetical protein